MMNKTISTLVSIIVLAASSFCLADEQSQPAGVIQLDETVISGNQELPKVLYILPWQQPNGLPDIQIETEFTELEVFRRLYPPAYRRELAYFETFAEKTRKEQ